VKAPRISRPDQVDGEGLRGKQSVVAGLHASVGQVAQQCADHGANEHQRSDHARCFPSYLRTSTSSRITAASVVSSDRNAHTFFTVNENYDGRWPPSLKTWSPSKSVTPSFPA
jgi:hypothetical protein